MSDADYIPNFGLYGETSGFPDVVHIETLHGRAPALGWKIPPHRHGEMSQIFQISRGNADVQVDGEKMALTDDTALFVPAQVVHALDIEPDTMGRVISMPLPILNSLGPASPLLTRWLSRPRLCETPQGFEDMLRLLEACFHAHSPFRAQRLAGLVHAVVARLAETVPLRSAGESGVMARMQELDQLVAAHLEDRWGLSDYASAMNITAGQLSRICRTRTGLSGQAYIETAVMTEAKRMLAFTQIPVAEVGYRLGYGDPAYFSRRFRAVAGQTPSDYRSDFMS